MSSMKNSTSLPPRESIPQLLAMMTRMVDCMQHTLVLLQTMKNKLDFNNEDLRTLEEFSQNLKDMRALLSLLDQRFWNRAGIGTATVPGTLKHSEVELGTTNPEHGKTENGNQNNPSQYEALYCNVSGCSHRNQKSYRKHGAIEEKHARLEDYPNDDNHPNIIKDKRGLKLPENGYGYELFYAMHRRRNNIAQIIEISDETQSFNDLLCMSVKTAVKLKKKGLTQEDIICVCVSNSKYSSVPYLAGLFLGCTMSALDISFGLEDIVYLLKITTPTIMFVDEGKVGVIKEAIQKIGTNVSIIVIGHIEGLENIEEYITSTEHVNEFRPYKVKSMRETCAIVFSGGTTGYPKAICISHNNLLYQIMYTAINGNLNGAVLGYTSSYGISGIILMGYCILTGSPRILPKPFDESRFYTLVDKHKVQIAFLGPFECIRLVKSAKPPGMDTSSMKWIIAGGAALKEEYVFSLRRIFQPCKVMQSYGLTETTGPIFKWDVTSPEDLALCFAKPASTGRSCGGAWYKVIDEDTGKILGPNQPGEVCIKSETLVMNGYYRKNPSECFDENGWLKTGDLGYYDEYHCFTIIDRIKELIKYRGWHVPPGILEDLLLKHPSVASAVVIGLPHPEDGEHPTGLIILKDGINPEDVNLQEVAKFVNEKIDDKKNLRGGVKIIQSLPRTARGKIDRKSLRNSLMS